MTQGDLNLGNQSGANFRDELNTNLQALGTLMAGATAPGTTYPGLRWWDTANSLIKIRNGADNAWITIAAFDGTTLTWYSAGVMLSGLAKYGSANVWTAVQRQAFTTDNDGSFDLSAGQMFKCTPSGSVTLTFTNMADGVSGVLLLINTGGQAISLHANTKARSGAAGDLTVVGTYVIPFVSDGTNTYLMDSEAMV